MAMKKRKAVTGNTGNARAAKPTRPDLLGRIAAVVAGGTSEKAVLDAVGLDRAFFAKAKVGGLASSKADASWAKVKGWLDANHPAPGSGPVTGGSMPTLSEGAQLVRRLAQDLKDAATIHDLDETMKVVSELAALEVISGQLARVLKDLCHQRRMNLIELEKQRRAIDSRKPVTVHVVWSSDWRRKVEVNEAAAKAEAHEDGDGL